MVWWSPGLLPTSVVLRLAAALALLISALAASHGPAAAVPTTGCHGDEQLVVAPSGPRVGEPVIVAAISRSPHAQARLRGPVGSVAVAGATVGDLTTWQAQFWLDQPGEHAFAFDVLDGIDVIATCATAVVWVVGADEAPGTVAGLLPAFLDGASLPGLPPDARLVPPGGRSPVASGGPATVDGEGADVQAADPPARPDQTPTTTGMRTTTRSRRPRRRRAQPERRRP